MCSTANYVLPLRRTCEVGPSSSRLCGGVSPQANFPGVRSNGAQQDTEMDVAWQELMAITELQEFEAPSDGAYESTQYQTMQPMVPMGEYVISQSQPPPAACEMSTAVTYEGCYNEEATSCHRLSNLQSVYGNSETHLSQRILPISFHSQYSIPNMSGTSLGHRRTNGSLSQGLNRHMLWTTLNQGVQTRSPEDLESDSGLSLGSSPPLASPDNPTGCAPGYQNVEADSIPEQASRRHTQYSLDYQNQMHPYLQPGAQTPFLPPHRLSHLQSCALTPRSAKQQSPADPSNGAVMSNRGSSQNGFPKLQEASPTSGSLSRDERRAMTLKIPFPMDKIINLPVDDFNELLTQYTLTDNQLALVRDIRRRGKNKVAAQNCRKRKLESILHLERELNQLQSQREHLAQERLEFQRSLAFVKCRITDLYTKVFSHLRDEDGQPYSIDEYSLQHTPDGKVYLVPHTMQD